MLGLHWQIRVLKVKKKVLAEVLLEDPGKASELDRGLVRRKCRVQITTLSDFELECNNKRRSIEE